MNTNYQTTDEIPKLCSTQKNLEFSFIGHVTMGVAYDVIFRVTGSQKIETDQINAKFS